MKKIIVYSTPSCPHCNNLKTYLTEKGLEFQDHDVSKDKEKAKELLKKTGRGAVPVVDIEGSIIIGFDRPKIERVLSGLRTDRNTMMQNLVFDLFSQ